MGGRAGDGGPCSPVGIWSGRGQAPGAGPILHIDLKGRDPDEWETSVPYEKGALLWSKLEGNSARDRFERSGAEYLTISRSEHQTGIFVDYLKKHCRRTDASPARRRLTNGHPGSALVRFPMRSESG